MGAISACDVEGTGTTSLAVGRRGVVGIDGASVGVGIDEPPAVSVGPN